MTWNITLNYYKWKLPQALVEQNAIKRVAFFEPRLITETRSLNQLFEFISFCEGTTDHKNQNQSFRPLSSSIRSVECAAFKIMQLNRFLWMKTKINLLVKNYVKTTICSSFIWKHCTSTIAVNISTFIYN